MLKLSFYFNYYSKFYFKSFLVYLCEIDFWRSKTVFHLSKSEDLIFSCFLLSMIHHPLNSINLFSLKQVDIWSWKCVCANMLKNRKNPSTILLKHLFFRLQWHVYLGESCVILNNTLGGFFVFTTFANIFINYVFSLSPANSLFSISLTLSPSMFSSLMLLSSWAHFFLLFRGCIYTARN